MNYKYINSKLTKDINFYKFLASGNKKDYFINIKTKKIKKFNKNETLISNYIVASHGKNWGFIKFSSAFIFLKNENFGAEEKKNERKN